MKQQRREQQKHNSYDNLEYCLQLLYDYISGSEQEEEVAIITAKPIDLHAISVKDIIKDNNFDYASILNKKDLMFLGASQNKLYFRKKYASPQEKNLSCIIAISQNNQTNKEIYNALIHYIASELAILEEHFMHVLLPVMFFRIIDRQDIIKISPPNIPPSQEILADQQLFALITENYDNTLEDYINHHHEKISEKTWKIILFQILIALVKLDVHFNGFAHNKLDLHAIKLTHQKATGGGSTAVAIIYKIHTLKFSVPNQGINIKLSDFENCSVGIISLLPIRTVINLPPKKIEQKYLTDDVKYLCSQLITLHKKNSIMPKSVEKFLSPKSVDNNSILDEYLAPIYILKNDEFFKEFIIAK